MVRLVFGAVLVAAAQLSAQVVVPTAQYNNSRTAANLSETALKTSNVSAATFGRLFSRVVDEAIYASPLIVANVAIPDKGNHNVVYVATMNNSVYAFDADDPAQTNALWFRNLGPAESSSNGDIQSRWGILGTPVIYNGTMYLVAYIGASYAEWSLYMCALDITSGADKYGAPVPILFPKGGSNVPATIGTIQRAALLAANDTIYVGFSNFDSVSDLSNQTGFIYSYAPKDISKPAHIFQPSPSKGDCGAGVTWRGGDIWQAGRGLAADAAGHVYVSTGNGYYDGIQNFGDTLLKLTPDLKLADWFTPSNYQQLCQGDVDLGASGPILIPSKNLALAGGKEGVLYVLNQTKLGHLQVESSAAPVTEFRATNGCHLVNCGQSLALAYWERGGNSILYVWDRYDFLRAYTFTSYSLNGRRLLSTPVGVGSLAPPNAGGVSVSSNGTTAGTGIVWATTSALDAEVTVVAGTLRAYDALDVTHELWNSDMNAGRDALGNFTKFSIPVVANGKVYVGTQSNKLQVYGLLP